MTNMIQKIKKKIDPAMVKKIKIPLLRYIYFAFLESEKIGDEFRK
jgi:hypothetical protein